MNSAMHLERLRKGREGWSGVSESERRTGRKRGGEKQGWCKHWGRLHLTAAIQLKLPEGTIEKLQLEKQNKHNSAKVLTAWITTTFCDQP